MICGVGSPEIATIAWVRAGPVGKIESKATSISLGVTVRTRSGDDYDRGQRMLYPIRCSSCTVKPNLLSIIKHALNIFARGLEVKDTRCR